MSPYPVTEKSTTGWRAGFAISLESRASGDGLLEFIQDTMTPPLSVHGTLNEADLLPVAQYTGWNRSPALKIMFGLGFLLILAGIGSLVMGEGRNAATPILLRNVLGGYPFAAPKLSIKKQLRASAHEFVHAFLRDITRSGST